MLRKILPLVVLLLGLGTGGAAAYGARLWLGDEAHPAPVADVAPPPVSFVPSGAMLAPLVTADGRLAGYVSFEIALEVPEDKVAFVTARLPLLFDAVNMRTYRTPMASGPDGMLPSLPTFRDLVMQAATQAFGKGVVRRVAVTQAEPA